MKMESMKSKMKWVFNAANKSALNGRGNGNINVEGLEIRPGGMLVQKRISNSNKNSVPIPSIKIRIKYGSLNYQICINSQASFGELKKVLAEQTGVHPQDQKLIYKKKERDSKAFLDIAGVKDGSKLMLIEDITSRERRSLEMLKSAKKEKASKHLQQISLEVDKFHTKVKALESTAFRGEKVAELDVDNLVEVLMNILVSLDGIGAEGDLKLQKGMQERRVQKYIETLDMLKLKLKLQLLNSIDNRTEEKISKQEEQNSTGIKPKPMQKPVQQQILRHSESFVITTNWETFD